MKTTTNTQRDFLQELVESHDFYQNNLKQREYLITNFERLKPDIAFSKRLNIWIEDFYNKHSRYFVFVDFDDFNLDDISETHKKHVERFKETAKIHIWTGASETTIFSDPKINWYFRAWHDYIHINYNLGYSFEEESMVASKQCAMLDKDWLLEKELVQIEILAQGQYFQVHSDFPVNQRKFCISYLRDPISAIFTKQNV
ncbi:hypothetical protein [Flavobacterium sp.]|jgi:hypothetical protein|uniref:hypothetical protein n=1 Tax=Flavobacterium sp. TaxID=239 RepID=UPI0037C16AB4